MKQLNIKLKWQLILWSSISLLIFISLYLQNPLSERSFYLALDFTLFVFFVVQVHSLFLLPKLLFQKKVFTYILFTIVCIFLAVFLYLYVYQLIHIKYAISEGINVITKWQEWIRLLMIALFLLLFSRLISFLINYFDLKEQYDFLQQEHIEAQKSFMQLQLQPHFLFNTLNNLYYVARKEAPLTSELLLNLADLMRFFITESKKKNTFLALEISLIQNYIALEKLRLGDKVMVSFQIKGEIGSLKVFPLMLMPLVENCFKHGVHWNDTISNIDLKLEVNDYQLIFSTENKEIISAKVNDYEGGMGLENLKSRLESFYNSDYKLFNKKENGKIIYFLVVNYE